MIMEDFCVTINKIEAVISISQVFQIIIISEHFGMSNVTASWALRNLQQSTTASRLNVIFRILHSESIQLSCPLDYLF